MPGDPKTQPSGPASGASGFRPDVEGLRAVAVGAVLLYHAGIPFAGGGYVGVDVFFVISGFLITGLLFRELEQTGTVSLARFYSRRAKRLLPLTVVVLGSVMLVAWPVFDPVRMEDLAFGIIAAALYFMNWLLAFQAADYFAAGLAASPVQHFWTLAVEEQFYLVWPVLLVALAWWCRRSGLGLRPVLAVALAIIVVASFAYGVHATEREAGAAYFSTFTRAWELALGGLLALAPASMIGRLGTYRRTSAAIAWAGLGAIFLAIYALGDDTQFPGFAALLPTLGAAAIIAAGGSKVSRGPNGLLTLTPVRHIGQLSYSWYLWHWPFLVFAGEILGQLSPLEGLAVALVSYLPALATNRLVERPFLHSPTLSQFPRKALGLGAACTASSVALGLVLLALAPTVSEVPESRVSGAKEIQKGEAPQESADAITPTPREAEDIRPKMHEEGCHLEQPDTEPPAPPKCVYGDLDSETTVFLFGDSHAAQWFPALHELARERGWRLVALSKAACTPADTTIYNATLRREYRECGEWRANVVQRIAKEDPKLVVTSTLTQYPAIEDGKRLGSDASEQALEEGYVSTLKKLSDSDTKVAVLEGVSHPNKDVPECVSRSPEDLKQCATPESEAFGYPEINARAADRVQGVTSIDPKPVLCRKQTCPAVIGDVLVYRNGSHLTPTYVRSLTSWLGDKLPSPDDS